MSTASGSGRFFAMVKYLDFFSEGVNLNVGGHAVFRTVYGSLFTIVYLGIMIYIIVMNASKYLDKSNPLAVGEVFSRENYPEINLVDNKIIPVMVAYKDETNWITVEEIDRYFTLVTQKIIWEAITDNSTKEVHLKKRFETYPTLPCSQLSEAELKEKFEYMGKNNYYYRTLTTYGICPQIPNSVTIVGKTSDEYFSQLIFKILPCSLPSASCAPASQLPLVNFQLLLPYTNLKVKDLTDPHDFAVEGDAIYYVVPSFRQVYTARVKQLNVYDFEGLFPSWRLQQTVYDIDSKFSTLTQREAATSCTYEEANREDNQQCLPYFEFVVQSSGVVANSKRTYVSLFDTLGAIGGTNGVIIVVMLMLYGPINEKKRREYMTRKVYSLIGVKEEDLDKGMEYISQRRQMQNNTQNRGDGYQVEGTDSQPNSQRVIKIEKRRWWTYICCCCRKKTPQEVEWEKKVNRAHARITDSLDVLSIVRNFNQLKVLTHFFFGERHFDMAQYVGFDLWQEECDQRDKRKLESQAEEQISKSQLAEERRNLRRVRISKRIVTEKQRFNHWLQYMKSKHFQRTKDKLVINSELNDELDEFFYQKLFDHHNSHNDIGFLNLIQLLLRDEATDTVVPLDDEIDGRHNPNENKWQADLPIPERCESEAVQFDERYSINAHQVLRSPTHFLGDQGSSPTDLILALVGRGHPSYDEGNIVPTVPHQ
jgi:hypothetical protein